MHKGRLEAFSDAVIAIVMTVMVLDLHVPKGSGFADLKPIVPVYLCYLLSFIFLAIYWNNHHHMLHAAQHVGGAALWANMHLLFWLSLIPFATDWMGGHLYARAPIILYGFLLFMCGAAYYLLSRALISVNGKDSALAVAVGSDVKGIVSVVIYAIAIGLAWLTPIASLCCYVLVAVMWIVPDRRIEQQR
ncbi:MAG: TMEM175 family protein [Fimbriimonas sp.]|nr:TMEM175 family protein [Fimbriimonas sp.]